MPRRLKRWFSVVLLAFAGVLVLAVAILPYLPLIHGTTAGEIERLAAWLEVQPGTRVADLGAGDGTFTVALARRVGSSGHVYATELDDEQLADIRQAATEAGLSNVTVIQGRNLADEPTRSLLRCALQSRRLPSPDRTRGNQCRHLPRYSSGWPTGDHRL